MKICFVLICFFFVYDSYSQIQIDNVLLGQSDKYVKSYLDSLRTIKPKAVWAIESQTAENGDLILRIIIDPDYENIYKCVGIYFQFKRIKSEEVCFLQHIMCSQKFSYDYVAHIKDTYELTASGNWQKKIPSNDLKINVAFENIDSDLFKIKYSLKL